MTRDIQGRREKGEVVAQIDNKVYVRLSSGASCGKCGMCSTDGKGGMILKAVSDEALKPGDRVYVFIKPGVVVKSAIALYIIPLAFLVVGYFLGTYISELLGMPKNNEAFPALFSLGLCGFSYSIVFLYDKIKRKDPNFAPYVKRIDKIS